MAERLEKPQDAVAVQRGADEDRHDLAGAQFDREVGEHLVARRLDVFQKLLHQRVVMVGEALQHGEARFVAQRPIAVLDGDHLALGMLAIDEGAVEREIDEAGDDAVP